MRLASSKDQKIGAAIRLFDLLFFLLMAAVCSKGNAQSNRADGHLTAKFAAQLWSGGKVDNSRLFIIQLHYWPSEKGVTDGHCDVTTIVIENLGCAPGLFAARGINIGAQYSSKAHNGDRGFHCSVNRSADGVQRLTIVETSIDGKLTHTAKFINQDRRSDRVIMTDYAATLTRDSPITRKLETAEYRPLRDKANRNFDRSLVLWENLELGCNKIEIPVLPTLMP
jgi:hypothetical protein